jgi:hypothetical protein
MIGVNVYSSTGKHTRCRYKDKYAWNLGSYGVRCQWRSLGPLDRRKGFHFGQYFRQLNFTEKKSASAGAKRVLSNGCNAGGRKASFCGTSLEVSHQFRQVPAVLVSRNTVPPQGYRKPPPKITDEV